MHIYSWHYVLTHSPNFIFSSPLFIESPIPILVLISTTPPPRYPQHPTAQPSTTPPPRYPQHPTAQPSTQLPKYYVPHHITHSTHHTTISRSIPADSFTYHLYPHNTSPTQPNIQFKSNQKPRTQNTPQISASHSQNSLLFLHHYPQRKTLYLLIEKTTRSNQINNIASAALSYSSESQTALNRSS